MNEVADDWSVSGLDLEAYLKRIGFEGAREPSAKTLGELYARHLDRVRFENLDVFLGGVKVDLESIQDKIVARGRGGYCYEQAQLFGAAAERLGFGVERFLARVGPDGGPARPRTHMTLRVRAGQDAWLADVGFGSSPPAPLRWPVDRASEGTPQEVAGWIYGVVPAEEHGQAVWKLRERQAGEWATLHRWTDEKIHPADVLLANHYTATHPDSWFTQQPVLVRRDQDAIRSIVGRGYTVTYAGHTKTRRDLTDKEFADALVTEFGLTLTPGELDAVVMAPQHKQ